jgi:hypothetical protein
MQLSISFISLIGMEWIKASLIGMDLSNKLQLFKSFKKTYLK